MADDAMVLLWPTGVHPTVEPPSPSEVSASTPSWGWPWLAFAEVGTGGCLCPALSESAPVLPFIQTMTLQCRVGRSILTVLTIPSWLPLPEAECQWLFLILLALWLF